MYWLRSIFSINSVDDIKFLANFYKNVSGELEVKQNENNIMSIEWTTNPFETLLNRSDLPNYPFDICSRLVGPDTVRATCICIDKLNAAEFEHPKKDLILKWASYIDQMIGSEINRRNDIGYIFRPPEQNLENMSELLLALKLSKYATHVIPLDLGFIMTNAKAAYLTCVGLTQEFSCTTSLMFDKDDGFLSPFEGETKSINYLNSRFRLWKANGYKGKISDYYQWP